MLLHVAYGVALDERIIVELGSADEKSACQRGSDNSRVMGYSKLSSVKSLRHDAHTAHNTRRNMIATLVEYLLPSRKRISW